MSYENSARIINDDIFDLINETFRQEKSSRNMKLFVKKKVVEIMNGDSIFLILITITLF